MELDPLLVLLDFLVGDSVETLARKNRLPHEHVEQALRNAMSSYGFDARHRNRGCWGPCRRADRAVRATG